MNTVEFNINDLTNLSHYICEWKKNVQTVDSVVLKKLGQILNFVMSVC